MGYLSSRVPRTSSRSGNMTHTCEECSGTIDEDYYMAQRLIFGPQSPVYCRSCMGRKWPFDHKLIETLIKIAKMLEELHYEHLRKA